MFTYEYKTTVQKNMDAKLIIKFLSIFFMDAILSFNLLDPDKILIIESQENEDHSDIVIEVLESKGFQCVRISN